MKIYILYDFKNQPWGGGNQFLKALKKRLEITGFYADNPAQANVVLFNSQHNLCQAFALKKKFPNKIFIHRIDGPIHLIRGRDKIIDKIIFRINGLIADGTVFQSNWSREKNKKYFGFLSKYETVIYNAPDKEIFNKDNKKTFSSAKIKLIADAWSSNWRKGFDMYKYLDENLDFSKYEMFFIGNSPIKFKNIQHFAPVRSEKLAEILKEQDIYITASQNDPCSNSLIEALCCGLPAVALNNGGHPELIQKGGELFTGETDILEKIEKVAKNYSYYQFKIRDFSIKEATDDYFEFAKKICSDVQRKRYQIKAINFLARIKFYKMEFVFLTWRITTKLKYYINKKNRI